ncbi:hypothetical protein KKC13_04475 [bacterium]|nr:hypothetical protein [bacterium]MBU1958251.1 hypothetical protein [bacterium]
MRRKKWLKTVALFSFLNLAFLMLVNHAIDPFNIFHTKLFKEQFQINERFTKIEYLEKNHHKFNGYLLGSSRIGSTVPEDIEQYIPNSNFYNMTLSSATIYDYLVVLKHFINNNYPVKTLYLQLDIDHMSFYGNDDANYFSKFHPYTKDESLALFYLKYLLAFSPLNLKGKIMQNIQPSNLSDYHITSGIWTNVAKEEAIKKDCKAYIDNSSEFNLDYRRVLNYTTSQQSMQDLQAIINLAKKHHIKLHIFTMPHNHNLMDTFQIEAYFAYLKDIAEMTDFYDFSGYNSVTNNDCNYYDISHYRPTVGKLIAARLFENPNIVVPQDFGIFVTKETIDERLKTLKKETYEKDNSHHTNTPPTL